MEQTNSIENFQMSAPEYSVSMPQPISSEELREGRHAHYDADGNFPYDNYEVVLPYSGG